MWSSGHWGPSVPGWLGVYPRSGFKWYGCGADLRRCPHVFVALRLPRGGARQFVTRVSYTGPAMSKICHVCAKGPAFGNNRSHSMVATKRRFDPNLQRVRIDDGGSPRRVYVCTRCLKAGKITKAR